MWVSMQQFHEADWHVMYRGAAEGVQLSGPVREIFLEGG